jgi:hypothetical protein
MAIVQTVILQGYAPDLDDIELLSLTGASFLVAAAIGGPGRVVATCEVSRRTQLRAKRKMPDVCATMGIECINGYELWRRLEFRIA